MRHTAHRQRSSPFLEEVRSAVRVRHYSLRTTQIYTPVLGRVGCAVVSPLNALLGG